MKGKTYTKSILLTLIGLTLASGGFAKGKLAIHSYKQHNQAVISALADDDQIFKIEITDSYGTLLYSTGLISGASFQKIYSMANLSNGTYMLSYIGKSGKVTQKFQLIDGIVTQNSELNATTPLDPAMTIGIKVSHNGNLLVDSALIKDNANEDLSQIGQLPDGAYQVSLQIGNRTVQYAVSK